MIVGSTSSDRLRTFTYGGEKLSVGRTAKILGVVFNDRGTWTDQVDALVSKAAKFDYVLAPLLRNKYLRVDMKLHIRKSKTLSCLLHGSEVVTPSASQFRRLEAAMSAVLSVSSVVRSPHQLLLYWENLGAEEYVPPTVGVNCVSFANYSAEITL